MLRHVRALIARQRCCSSSQFSISMHLHSAAFAHSWATPLFNFSLSTSNRMAKQKPTEDIFQTRSFHLCTPVYDRPLWEASLERKQSSLVLKFIRYIENKYEPFSPFYDGDFDAAANSSENSVAAQLIDSKNVERRPLNKDPLENQNSNFFVSNFKQNRFSRNVDISSSLFEKLHLWSIQNPATFWSEVWDFCDVVNGTKGVPFYQEGSTMIESLFFPHGYLNFAENLLRFYDDSTAIISWCEDQYKNHLTYKQLYDQVSVLVQALKAEGVQAGDRVVGIVANTPQAIVAMLATTALGGVWSSCSPDFGVSGLADRFGQIHPKIMFSVDFYLFKGNKIECLSKAEALLQQLPSVHRLIILPYLETGVSTSNMFSNPKSIFLASFTSSFSFQPIPFVPMPFNAPLFILFSSGTTGLPKCIVHRTGILLQLMKEHQLHVDIQPGDRVFYFTTCSWMMWNWMVTALASKATLLLYDGNPLYPKSSILWDFAVETGCTFFGTSAKYIDFMKKEDLRIKNTHDLSSLKTLSSTGSPLSHESFEYVYSTIKDDLHLVSLSGGTDICSCFLLGNPLGPVWKGELQTKGLGMAVDVFDENGNSLKEVKGELVCTKPFIAQPVGFFNDLDGSKYRKAYFDKYPNVWAHGDLVELTKHNGIIMYGRSDSVLNPGGVRIGTSEIYRQVEKLNEIIESVAVGRTIDMDEQVLLFVILKEKDRHLSPGLIQKIKLQIRTNTTPRHVPHEIHQVNDIPRTKTGKIAELAIRDTIHHRPVRNVTALANPSCLEEYQKFSIPIKSKL